MGAWWQLEAGSRLTPLTGKNTVPDELMLLFTDADHFVDEAQVEALSELEDAPEEFDADEEPWPRRMVGYSATAGTLRARLELQGFGTLRVHALCAALFDDDLEPDPEFPSLDMREGWPEGQSTYPDGSAVVDALATRRGQDLISRYRQYRPRSSEQKFLEHMWELMQESFDDPRFELALILSRTNPSTRVTLDLTDVVTGGYVSLEEQLHLSARTRMATAVAASGPIIVITEGSSDARWLRHALRLAAPDTEHLFEFLDFDQARAPGGVDRVESLTKGMAAAGVMNRIIAVFDNDTAGREGARRLSSRDLPTGVRVICLPDVPYAQNYPTLGPTGPAPADINGRASSIEFMFGEDVLRSRNNELYPVQWNSLVTASGAYQGSLSGEHKRAVAARLDDIFANSGTQIVPSSVLEGCRRLAETLHAAAAPSPYVPGSEYSELSAQWRAQESAGP